MTERFIKLFEDEVYYLVDTEGLKTLQDFIDETTKDYINEGYSYDIIKEVAKEEYDEYLYEHTMSAQENIDLLNKFYIENEAMVDLIKLNNKEIEKKNAHQRVLESKIRRMREAIHKLEWLASHRNADLIRENHNLKNRISILEAFLKQNDLLYEIDWIEFCTVAKCNQPDDTDCETCFYLGEYPK